MGSQEAYEHEPISHAVAHHLVAIAELLDEYGYARVTDVARSVGITRGSASITLKGLRQKGLVTVDDRRFLGLSDEGRRVADSVRAKRAVMRDLLIKVLGVEPAAADEETCRFEHLVSGRTAQRAERLLEFIDAEGAEAKAFLKAFSRFARARRRK